MQRLEVAGELGAGSGGSGSGGGSGSPVSILSAISSCPGINQQIKGMQVMA